MDTDALKATLTHLASTMPAMAKQVNEGIETGHAALTDGNDLVQHGNQLVDAANQELQQAEQAVHEFTSFANEAKSQLEHVYQELEAKIHEFSDIDPVLDQVDQITGQVEEAFHTVQGVLSDGAHALTDASNTVNQHLDGLFGAIDQGHQQLSQGIDTVNHAFDAVHQAVQQGHDQRDAVPPGHPDVGGACRAGPADLAAQCARVRGEQRVLCGVEVREVGDDREDAGGRESQRLELLAVVFGVAEGEVAAPDVGGQLAGRVLRGPAEAGGDAP